ncbi:MAG: hypothetical protein K2L70_03505 [Clostridia bacterium]|nr:hypothetical protein [Clostridia bacterium]
MFNFNNNQNYPIYNNQNRRMTAPDSANDFETLQNARRDLVGELDAIIQYDDHLHRTDNELARTTWENIRNEELTHVGELLGLINYLAPYQKPFIEQGLKEFNDRLQNKS